MRESLVTVFILLVTIVAINLTTIYINWYTIKADIQDIPDKNTQVNLLQSLRPMYKIFFQRIFYNHTVDYFSCKRDYLTFITYMNIHHIKFNAHKYHRYESSEYINFDDIVKPKSKHLETRAEEEVC